MHGQIICNRNWKSEVEEPKLVVPSKKEETKRVVPGRSASEHTFFSMHSRIWLKNETAGATEFFLHVDTYALRTLVAVHSLLDIVGV